MDNQKVVQLSDSPDCAVTKAVKAAGLDPQRVKIIMDIQYMKEGS